MIIMIKSKEELKLYLEADRIALGRKDKKPGFFDLVYKFEVSLRINEYYNNCRHGIIWKPIKFYNIANRNKFSELNDSNNNINNKCEN